MTANRGDDSIDDRRRPSRVLAVVTACVAMGGCSTISSGFSDPAERKAYQTELERQVQGYVYEMGCEALLPMAKQVLWDEGHHDVEYTGESRGLQTGWNAEDDRVVQYEVVAQQAGSHRCAVQFIRRSRDDAQTQRRDIDRELELIEAIDEKEARRIRSQAREAAEAVDTP